MWKVEELRLKMLTELTEITGTCEMAEKVVCYLKRIEEEEKQKRRRIQREGIQKAKTQGVHLGRPRKKLPENSDVIFRNYLDGTFTAGQAANCCGIGVSTLYRRVKDWEKENGGKGENSCE